MGVYFLFTFGINPCLYHIDSFVGALNVNVMDVAKGIGNPSSNPG